MNTKMRMYTKYKKIEIVSIYKLFYKYKYI